MNNDIHSIADWAELYVLYKNSVVSKLELINQIKINLPEIKDDVDRTNLANSIFTELSFRSNILYGDCSHFEIAGDTIAPKLTMTDAPEVAMCLIFSLKGVAIKKGRNSGTKYFEQMSNIASMTYVGNSRLVGFPNDKNLDDQILNTCIDCLEHKGHQKPRKHDKDGGVDIIAWKSFNDKRSNQIVVLLQCGAGKHFDQKKPINIVKWKRWVHWAFEPVTGIITPKMIREDHEWEELSDYYKMVLDRPRLIRFLHNSPHSDNALKKKINRWCLNNIN